MITKYNTVPKVSQNRFCSLTLSFELFRICCVKYISGRVDRASASETVDQVSIPDCVKPNTVRIGIHKLPASSALKETL